MLQLTVDQIQVHQWRRWALVCSVFPYDMSEQRASKHASWIVLFVTVTYMHKAHWRIRTNTINVFIRFNIQD
jgi:hypothetical protein